MDYKRKYIIYKQKYLNSKSKTTIIPAINPDELLDPKTKLFSNALKGKIPLCKLSITDARKLMSDIQVDESYKKSIDIEITNIKTKAGEIPLRIFRPKDSKEILPVILYYHGSGWMLGNSQVYGRLLTEISNAINAAVVYVGYSSSPEKKYPTQLIQAYDALLYIANNATKHNLDANKLFVMGDGVGGTMTIVVTMLSRERHGPKISYQILLYPIADASMSSHSYQNYSNGPWLTKQTMEWFLNSYEADMNARTMATISPINANPEHIKGILPVLIITAKNDVLRDDGENLAHKLMCVGIDVTAVRYLGTIHDFLMLDTLKSTPASKSAIKLIAVHIKDVIQNR